MHISVNPATEADRSALESLFQLYVYDFTDFKAWDVEANGRFQDASLRGCWTQAHRHPFLIRVDGKLAGFAIVDGRSQLTGVYGPWDLADFFILRHYQKRGVGERAARALFDAFGGHREVRVMVANLRALAFWRTVINPYTHGQFEEVTWDDARWRGPVYFFDSGC